MGLSKPLSALDGKIDKLVGLLTTILFAIVLAAFAIVVGTPIAAILIYHNRRKLFPKSVEQDVSGARIPEKV
jgi:hypothetical protein